MAKGDPIVAKFPMYARQGMMLTVFKGNDGYYTVMNKSYKSKAGDWKHTPFMSFDDLYTAKECLERAIKFLETRVEMDAALQQIKNEPASATEDELRDFPY